MTNHQYINEDKRPQKLSVGFSKELSELINDIYSCNQDNIDNLRQFAEYIEGLNNYIANPVIAWDYNGKYAHFPNGAVHLHELGYDVKFIIRNNKANHNYVYVFNLSINLHNFSLKEPCSITEYYPSDIRPKEISKDTLYRIMSEQYERYLHNLF